MTDICPDCKTMLTKKDEYCPVCNKHIGNAEDKTEKKTHPRLKRCAPYLTASIVSLIVLAVCFVMLKRTVLPEILAEKTGMFSKETLYSERYYPFFNLMCYAFSFLAIIFGCFAIFCFCAKPKEGRKFNLYALCFSLLLCITTGTVIFAYTKHHFERDRIEVLSKDELNFSMSVVHGKNVNFDQSFENSMYTYYSIFCHAYNDLTRTGDYKTFFDTVNENNFPDLTHKLAELKKYHMSNEYITQSNRKLANILLPSQIPFKSLEEGNIPSNTEIIHLAKNYENIKVLDIIVKKYVTRANVLFDIFYGKELALSHDTLPKPKDYVGSYCHALKKNVLTIYSVEFDSNGDGKIEFCYSNMEKPLECKLDNRRAVFECKDINGKKQYGMLHITKDKVIVNISYKDRYVNVSDSFRTDEKTKE